jgi:hypothetical protein
MRKTDPLSFFLQWTARNTSSGQWTFSTTSIDGTSDVYLGFLTAFPYDGNFFYGVEDPLLVFDVSPNPDSVVEPIGEPVT